MNQTLRPTTGVKRSFTDIAYHRNGSPKQTIETYSGDVEFLSIDEDTAKITRSYNDIGQSHCLDGPAYVREYKNRWHPKDDGKIELYAVHGAVMSKLEFDRHSEVIAFREDNSWSKHKARQIWGVFSRVAKMLNPSERLASVTRTSNDAREIRASNGPSKLDVNHP